MTDREALFMECKKFELAASAYIDRKLKEVEANEYRLHLLSCTGCRIHLAETQAVSLSLKSTDRPELPRELHSNIMREATRRARKEITFSELVFEWLLKLNPRPVSVAAGILISVVSFTSLFSSFRPIPLDGLGPRNEAAAIYPIISGSDREYHNYNNLPPLDSASATSSDYYQLPRVLDNSALVSFSHIAYQKPGNQGMTALVEVDPDGRGRLIDVIDPPSDSYMVEQLWWSLRDRTFQPATVSGHPVPTRIILLVEKMDVGG